MDVGGLAQQEDVTFTKTVASGITTYTGASVHNAKVIELVVYSNGAYDVTQWAPIVHPTSGATEETLDIVFAFTVIDGDDDTAQGSLTVQVNDDTPELTVVANPSVTAQLDESSGSSLPATLGVASIGDDTDVAGAGAIATAVTLIPAITAAVQFGADGPAANGALDYTLEVTNPASGLFVTDNSAIALAKEGDVVVGRVASGTLSGMAAFAIGIDASTGALKVEQYLSLKHPNASDPNDLVALAAGSLQASLTITDGDGDSITRSADISGQISFADDAPTLSLSLLAGAALTIDETDGVAANANETDPLGGDLGTATLQATNYLAGITSFGADGPGTISYTLGINIAQPTGFFDTATGLPIVLEGISATALKGVAGPGGATVFTISVDGLTGTLTMTQLRAIMHDDPTDPDEAASPAVLAAQSINLSKIIVDADGDQAASSISIGSLFRFEDDGPSISLALNNGATLTIDETDGVSANANEIDPVGGSLGSATIAATDYLVATESFGADGPGSAAYTLSINIAEPTGLTDTATGLPIVLEGISATSLKGVAGPGGPTVFTISIDGSTGALTLTQQRAILHDDPADPDEAASPAILSHASINLTRAIIDGDGDQAASSISIGSLFRFEDDGPSANPISKTINESADIDSNVTLILDISGSMNDPSGLTGLSRLDALKASVTELLEQYNALGNVAVRIVTFSTNASAIGTSWMTIDAAKATVQGLSAGGSTNYDEALTDIMSAFGSPGSISGAQNVSYFLSDGQPTAPPGDVGLDAAEQAAWEAFVDTNNIVSFSLGMGTGINATATAELDKIAYNGATSTDTNALVVTDLSQLAATLVSTVSGATTSGNLLADGPASFGVDGGYVSSVAIGGKTFTYNPVTDTVSVTGAGAATHTFNPGTNVITIATAIGGALSLDLDNGAYSYTGPASVASNQSDAFTYTLKDGDGDTATSTLTIDILNEDRPPLVRDDIVITNTNSPIVIPHFALVHNDTDPDGQPISVSAAGAPQSSGTALNGATSVSFTDTGGAGGSFTYTGSTSSPSGSDTGTVTVTRLGTSTDPLNGNGLDNILIDNDSSNTLRGYEGDDVLIGNGGNDNLNGGLGIDLLQGGSGNDTFIFSTAADSASLATADTILDFDVASATERIDLTAIYGPTLGFQAAQTTSTAIHTVTWSQDAGSNTTIVRADINGDTTADFVLKLTGLLTLSSAEFSL
ncbi:MAG: DUF5801 repeats-in-toxin domain-containing protein [Hyphomicrobiaceae bacterium]